MTATEATRLVKAIILQQHAWALTPAQVREIHSILVTFGKAAYRRGFKAGSFGEDSRPHNLTPRSHE